MERLSDKNIDVKCLLHERSEEKRKVCTNKFCPLSSNTREGIDDRYCKTELCMAWFSGRYYINKDSLGNVSSVFVSTVHEIGCQSPMVTGSIDVTE